MRILFIVLLLTSCATVDERYVAKTCANMISENNKHKEKLKVQPYVKAKNWEGWL